MTQTVMVVEDDRPILELMEILLNKLGYRAVLVQDVTEALRIAEREPPDLVLLDIMMTPVNGWYFLEQLRGRLNNMALPVVIFTASPTAEEDVRRLNDPRTGMLQKPVSLADLKRSLEQFL